VQALLDDLIRPDQERLRIVRPSALAVFICTTKSNLTGRWTGSGPGQGMPDEATGSQLTESPVATYLSPPRTLHRAGTNWTHSGGFSIHRAEGEAANFKFSNREAPSGTIGHYWQQSQALVQPSVRPL